MQPKAHQPSTIQQIQHWLAHAVNWGDAPTWFAGIFGAVAAFYALRGFRTQRKQVADLAEKQALTDKLLAYQAHAYARSIITGVAVEWLEAEHPDERCVILKNLSSASISDISLTATLGGIPCVVLDRASKLVNIDSGSLAMAHGWASPGEVATQESFGTVIPQSGVRWVVHADNAPAGAELAYTVEFNDEVGGRWSHDENDRVRLINGPTA